MNQGSIDVTSLQVAAVGTLVMFLRYIVVTGALGVARARIGARAPEDNSIGINNVADEGTTQTFGVGENNQNAKLEDIATFKRWDRIMANDLENVPFGMVVVWAGLLCGGNTTVQVVASILFFAGRVFHTITYAKAIQPWRTISWIVALIAVLVMAANNTHGVFTSF